MTTVAQALRRSGRPALLVPPRSLKLLHRWLGITVGFLFALWFASGAVLCFVPFPTLPSVIRIAHSEPIDLGRVRIAPAAALAAAPGLAVQRLRLISVDGHPRYVLSVARGPTVSVSAESGKLLGPLSADAARAVAASFSRRPVAAITGPLEDDQWIVHDQYDPYRPFYRVSLGGGRGTELYVSARSGQVLQQTRRVQREWNYIGAIVHWVNIVSLRRHKDLWRGVMLTLGSTCGLLACAGLGLGVIHLINMRRARRRGLSPFRGWLRWHHSVGLFASALLISWIVSGCLMLDGGTVFPSDQPTAAEIAALRGMTLAEAAKRFPVALLRTLPPARQVEITAVADKPFLVASNGGQSGSWIATPAPDGGLSLSRSVPDSLLLAAIRSAWPSVRVLRIRPIQAHDAYQVISDPLPSSARRIVLADPAQTWLQIDSATGRMLSVTDTRSRARRWWVNGLHDFDFPSLDRSGPLRILMLMLAVSVGFLFSCTGFVVGVKRLRRTRA
ncbi:MAG: peptidase [Proteobacteria bacterium]|nr:peptidase [Pseudomonadota bacterium]